MRIRLGVPDGLNKDETKAVLDAALEAVTRASEPLIARGKIPTFSSVLQRKGVRWRPEPPGDEHFDLPQTVIRRGWGDCDDLAPWRAAELRASGVDPEATAIVRPSGPNRWHAVVERHDGRIDDPSKAAGMGSVGGDEYQGPFWPSMFDRLALAASPLYPQGWGARVDIPDMHWPHVWSSVAKGRKPAEAVSRAIMAGLHVCGESASDIDVVRLCGLHDLLSGHTLRDVGEALAQEFGDEAVGFLPMLAPAAASLAAPLAEKALGMFGGMFGGGGKAAPAPAPAAPGAPMPMMSPAQAPGATLSCPGGPIIVRF